MNNQRSELSTHNPYHIPKFRYLELRNFCLQYKNWKLALKEIQELQAKQLINPSFGISNPTENIMLRRQQYESYIQLIEDCAIWADPTIYKWIIKGVTECYSYDYLHLVMDLPAGRSTYYDRYRRFFWILDQKRK